MKRFWSSPPCFALLLSKKFLLRSVFSLNRILPLKWNLLYLAAAAALSFSFSHYNCRLKSDAKIRRKMSHWVSRAREKLLFCCIFKLFCHIFPFFPFFPIRNRLVRTRNWKKTGRSEIIDPNFFFRISDFGFNFGADPLLAAEPNRTETPNGKTAKEEQRRGRWRKIYA